MKKKPTAKKTTARKPARKKPSKTTAKKTTAKKKYQSDIWQPLGGSFLPAAYDSFGEMAAPSPGQLVGAFTDTVYSCATLIADSLAEIDIRLVAETGDGQTAPADAPKMFKRGKHRSKAVELHEVLSNPALDLLYHPNPELSYADLIRQTAIDLECLGRAFWLITDYFDRPARIDVLPAYLVTTQRDDRNRVTGYWVGQVGTADEPPTFPADRVLAFRHYERMDPYQEGVSPVRAVWQKLQLSFKELSSWETIVGQMAHPSIAFSPKDTNAPLSPEAAERFVKEYQNRLARGGQGGPLFLNEPVDLNILTFPPKDTAGLQLQDNLKTSVCNAFRVPRPLLDMQDSNFASASASLWSFQKFCLMPRISYILERITHRIVTRFDARLYLEHDDFITKDEQLELQRQTAAVAAYTAQVVTLNESRARLDLPPVASGDKFYTAPAPAVPSLGLGLDQPDQSKAKAFDPAKKYDKYPLKPVVEVLQKWFAVQKDFVLSQATTKAFKSKAFVDLSGFSDDMAKDLRPALQLYYDGAAKSLISRLGLTDDVWTVTQPRLREAVNRACLTFAQSTNRTTALLLDDAREKLRQELADGITQGDLIAELSKRVQSVFDSATDERAWLIADSERTRAIGTAEIISAKESGVVKSKVWLADNMACDLCKSLNGVSRQLDEPFAINPKAGPYAVTQHPPGHPGCRCALTYEIAD